MLVPTPTSKCNPTLTTDILLVATDLEVQWNMQGQLEEHPNDPMRKALVKKMELWGFD